MLEVPGQKKHCSCCSPPKSAVHLSSGACRPIARDRNLKVPARSESRRIYRGGRVWVKVDGFKRAGRHRQGSWLALGSPVCQSHSASSFPGSGTRHASPTNPSPATPTHRVLIPQSQHSADPLDLDRIAPIPSQDESRWFLTGVERSGRLARHCRVVPSSLNTVNSQRDRGDGKRQSETVPLLYLQ